MFSIRTIEAAWSYIQDVISPVSEKETVRIVDAAHRVVSSDIFCKLDIPRYRHTAMDGISIDARSAVVADQRALPLLGRLEPGTLPVKEHPAGAIRVFTGAILPEDTYAVVREEDCQFDGAVVAIRSRPKVGENIREAGEDVGAGTVILKKGTRLGPQELALASSAGCSHVNVYRRPRAKIVATGNELVLSGNVLGDGQIFDSNGIMAKSMLESMGFEAGEVFLVKDSVAAISSVILDAQCDVVVLSGGMSRGESDCSIAAIEGAGGKIAPIALRLRPGKPARLGHIGHTVVLGLPGNPFAAFVAMRVLGEVAARRIAGASEIAPRRIQLSAGFSYSRQTLADEFLPGRLRAVGGRSFVERIGRGGSARLMPLSLAEGLCRLDPQQTEISEGDTVEWWPMN